MDVLFASQIRSTLNEVDELFDKLKSLHPEMRPSDHNPFLARLWRQNLTSQVGVNAVAFTDGKNSLCIDQYYVDPSAVRGLKGFLEFDDWPMPSQIQEWGGDNESLPRILPTIKRTDFNFADKEQLPIVEPVRVCTVEELQFAAHAFGLALQ